MTWSLGDLPDAYNLLQSRENDTDLLPSVFIVTNSTLR